MTSNETGRAPGEGAVRNCDQLGGQINFDLIENLTDRQASRIARTYLVSYSVAAAIAWLAYGVAR